MTAGFVKAISADAIAVGGMKAVTLEGQELVVCNSNGTFFAVERRCGHMNAPLEMGTLDGTIVTCPMHCAQFDLPSGAALCGPMPRAPGSPAPTPRAGQLMHHLEQMIREARTLPVRTFETKVDLGSVWVCLPS
jgi:nitrite reductase/ring-hydroxylating ferredoxin subunit